ncbi:MAG TPA: enoyl-CoA hydratase/isomerase family protein [Actinomycetota bacterium]|nr:enoyl-CoA hydratase/isomerase family protein [Actinomycetota bacterium]
MSDLETLKYGVHNGVATISLNRPTKLNAVNAQMFADLAEASERASFDPGVRVIVVRAEGRAFSAGIDVNLMGQLAGSRGARFRTWVRGAQQGFLNLARADKPTLAAVHGHALGAGFQIALACDLRIVTHDVSFGMFEVKFGLIPDLGGTHRLTRLVGPAVAKELVWTGRTVDAEEALRLGLANRIVEREVLDKEAEAFARELAASPPIPVSLAKSLITRATETPLETDLDAAAHAQAQCVETEDHREAVAAFLEKRPPRFTGR